MITKEEMEVVSLLSRAVFHILGLYDYKMDGTLIADIDNYIDTKIGPINWFGEVIHSHSKFREYSNKPLPSKIGLVKLIKNDIRN